MFVEEMLFILGHRDVENVDAFVREMDKKAEMLDGIEGMGIVRIYDNKHWTTDYNILKEKAETLDNIIKAKHWTETHQDYTVHDFAEMVEKAEKFDFLDKYYHDKIYRNIDFVKKLEAVKDVLKLPDCKSSEETPDLILGFEEQFYLKKILEGDGSGGTET